MCHDIEELGDMQAKGTENRFNKIVALKISQTIQK